MGLDGLPLPAVHWWSSAGCFFTWQSGVLSAHQRRNQSRHRSAVMHGIPFLLFRLIGVLSALLPRRAFFIGLPLSCGGVITGKQEDGGTFARDRDQQCRSTAVLDDSAFDSRCSQRLGIAGTICRSGSFQAWTDGSPRMASLVLPTAQPGDYRRARVALLTRYRATLRRCRHTICPKP